MFEVGTLSKCCPRGDKLKYLIIWVIIFVIVELMCLFVYYQSTGFKVTEYTLHTDKNLPHDIKFVMLTDLHDTDLGNDNQILLDKIDELTPDFVILAGDMITSYMQPAYNSDITFSFLERLAAKHRVYYGLGNHEQRYYCEPEKFVGKFEELKQFVGDIGIHFLCDEYIDLPEYNCTLFGLNIPIEYYRRVVTKKLPEDYIDGIFPTRDDSRLNILLAHNPDQFDSYAAWQPDIVCSGHVHGGIIGIPWLGGLISPQLKLFPKYDFGLFTEDKMTMILSRGIGWHTIPVRINNKAEVVCVTVKSDIS